MLICRLTLFDFLNFMARMESCSNLQMTNGLDSSPGPAPAPAPMPVPTANHFASLTVGGRHIHRDLSKRINAQSITITAQATSEPCFHMAIFQSGSSSGMAVQAGAGVGFFEVHIITTPPMHVTIGLTLKGASLKHAPGQIMGGTISTECGCSWQDNGDLTWTLGGPEPIGVGFGKGDRVMVVLDCRAGPVLRLLVNSHPCRVYSLAGTASCSGGRPPIFLCPAVALCGHPGLPESEQASVEIAKNPLLPPHWDTQGLPPSAAGP